MSLRFRKRVTLLPGLRMNLSGSGISWSVGPRGASLNFGKSGTYFNAGIPGTGLYSRTRISGAEDAKATAPTASQSRMAPAAISMEVHIEAENDGSITYHDGLGQPVSARVLRALKDQHGAELRARIKARADEMTASVLALGELHLGTPDPRQKPTFAPTPFEEPQPTAPPPKTLGFVAKLLPWDRHAIERDNAEAAQHARAEEDAWVQRKALHEGREAHRRQLIENDIYTTPAAMESYLEERLHAIAWPRETQVSFQAERFDRIDDSGYQLALDVDLPESEHLPTKTATVAATGYRILFHELSPAKMRKLYADLVYGIVFRMLGETFAALPAVNRVTLSGYAERTDHATGNTRNDYLVSVRVSRAQWERINFTELDKLDPAAALAQFELRSVVTTKGLFEPVVPLWQS
jgi:hypothetical protein